MQFPHQIVFIVFIVYFLFCLTTRRGPLTRLLPLLLSNVPPSPSPQLRPPFLSSGGASDVAAASHLPCLWSSPKLWRGHWEDCPVSPGLTKHAVVYRQFFWWTTICLFSFARYSDFSIEAVLCCAVHVIWQESGQEFPSQLYIDLHIGCCNSLMLIILHRPCMNTPLVDFSLILDTILELLGNKLLLFTLRPSITMKTASESNWIRPNGWGMKGLLFFCSLPPEGRGFNLAFGELSCWASLSRMYGRYEQVKYYNKGPPSIDC